MKPICKRRRLIFGISMAAGLLAAAALCLASYRYVTRYGPAYASVDALKEELTACGETICFEYREGPLCAVVRASGKDDPLLDVFILEKRLLWWTQRHFETAISPVKPLSVGGKLVFAGVYDGWGKETVAAVRLESSLVNGPEDNGGVINPVRQETFTVGGKRRLGYMFIIDNNRRRPDVWRFRFLDDGQRPIAEISPGGIARAEVRLVRASGDEEAFPADERHGETRFSLLQEAEQLYNARVKTDSPAADEPPDTQLVFGFPASAVRIEADSSYTVGGCTRLVISRKGEDGLRLCVTGDGASGEEVFEAPAAYAPAILRMLPMQE